MNRNNKYKMDRQLDRKWIDTWIENIQIVRQKMICRQLDEKINRQLDKKYINSQIENRQIVGQKMDRYFYCIMNAPFVNQPDHGINLDKLLQ